MTGQTKILVVNADDLGLSEEVNRSIIEAYENGIVRSASLMPNGPSFTQAVELVRGHIGLGVGVHIALTGAHCAAPPKELRQMVDDDGRLPASYGDFTRQFLSRRFGVGEVGIEIRAQLDRVLEAGIEPTHLDSHQHVHMLPALFSMFMDIAREYHIPAIRVALESGPGAAGCGILVAKGWLLSRIRQSRLKLIEANGLRTADWFWGLTESAKLDEAKLTGILRDLRPGVNEIVCHPGANDELAALQSGAVRRLIDENDIRLASFADAWEAE